MIEPYILIIDDDETLLAIVDSILHKNGFETSMAQDGEGGLSIIEDRLPQLILLDIKLPKMDGFEVLSALKNNKKTQAVPVIMLTSENDISAVSKCLEAGAQDYIVKPFDHNNLVARIRQVISQS